MRLFILADGTSEHTIRWVNSLLEQGIDTFLFSISSIPYDKYTKLNNFQYQSMNIEEPHFLKSDGSFSKSIYLKSVFNLKKCIKEFSPEILHAHYATSYGLIGALTGFHPLIISAWGSDIFNFPNKSFLHKMILKFNLSRADLILSTSKAMANEILKYSSKQIKITPFGIDIDKFKPFKSKYSLNCDIVIGTIKTLEYRYGIDYLINSFAKVKKRFNNLNLKLLIIGKGVQENYLKELTKNLGIQSDAIFVGYVDHLHTPEYYNVIDIFCALSLEESFGVSVLESCACEKPVIVSNAGGLPEIVENQKTGIVIEKQNIEQAVEAISELISNEDLRTTLGKNGRQKVIKEYNWQDSVAKMISVYNKILE